MSPVAPPMVVDAPAPTRRPYGLETVAATVQDTTDRHLGGVYAVRYHLGAAVVTVDGCTVPSPDAAKVTDRVPGANDDDPYEAFGVRVGLDCTGWALLDFEEFQRRIQVALEATEWQTAEGELYTSAGVGQASLISTAQTVAAASGVVDGLGQLEAIFGGETGIRGVLHASPRLGAHLAAQNVLVERQGRLETVAAGTPVVMSAAYTGEEPAGGGSTPGAEYLYMSGPLQVRRSTIQFLGDTPAEVLDRADNLAEVHSERWYTLVWDHDAVYAKLITLVT